MSLPLPSLLALVAMGSKESEAAAIVKAHEVVMPSINGHQVVVAFDEFPNTVRVMVLKVHGEGADDLSWGVFPKQAARAVYSAALALPGARALAEA